MPVEMVRIDDRLIHGQVLVGWCPVIRPDHLVLCDDQVAACDWERAIYEQASPDYKTSVLGVEETAKLLQGEAAKKERIFLVVGSPQTAEALLEKGVQVDRIVVGGLHHQPGKRKVLDYIYVSDRDVEAFRRLFARGIAVRACDLPGRRPVDLAKILGLDQG